MSVIENPNLNNLHWTPKGGEYLHTGLGKIWTHDWSERHFMHHKESLTTFLIRVFKEADSGFSSLGTNGNIAGLRWENPPGESTLDDPYLRFYLKQPPSVLISNPALASSVVCYLVFDEEEGLSEMGSPFRGQN